MKDISIGVVDNDEEPLQLLTGFVNRYSQEKGLSFSLKTYLSPFEFLEDRSSSFDLLFLDINMPQMNGMELAQKIRERGDKVILIFLTNLAQYAIEGYKVGAMDYVLKPVSYFDFSQEMNKAVSLIERSDDKVLL